MTENKEKSVDLSIILGTLVDAVRLTSRIASKQELSEEDRVECELLTEQFKEDFGAELLNA